MFLLLRLLNSIIFVIANTSIALYTLQRFFRAMKSHYQLMEEVEEFSSLVDESRASLDYVGAKVLEAMKEMELDIGKEVYVTHNLTKLNSKVGSVSKRLNDLEEGIIELARLSHNMENATVATPSDINEEVRNILISLKRSKSPAIEALPETPHQPLVQPRPRSSRKSTRPSRSHGAVEPPVQQPPISPVKRTARHSPRSRSLLPVVVPEVMLLDEQPRNNVDKPIGFRPPWMCQV